MLVHRQSAETDDPAGTLLSGYRPLPGIFDEMMDRDGRVRAHWRPFLSMLAALGGEEINRRFAVADRHLRESGVFYRVYEDPAGAERAWPLSHVPLLIEPTEWEALKAGLTQRAAVARSGAGGCLRSGGAGPRWPAAGGGDRRQSGIPAAAGRRCAAGRRASALLRGRSRPRRRRPMVGARAIARRRRPARATRWRTGSRCRARCPTSTAPCMSSGWRHSSRRLQAELVAAQPAATIRASACSRPGR